MGRAQSLMQRYEGLLAELGEPSFEHLAPATRSVTETVEGIVTLARAFHARWVTLHARTLESIGDTEAAGDLEAGVTALLRKRKGLVSACAQTFVRAVPAEGTASPSKATSAPPAASESARAVEAAKALLTEWISRHDAFFLDFLQTELGRLREDLMRAFEAKRALGAYARTMQYRGE